MGNERLFKRDTSYFKPGKFKSYFTIQEVCKAVDRHPTTILRLEKADKIPIAARIQRGQISVRLWSPAQVEEIKRVLLTLKPGRPPKRG